MGGFEHGGLDRFAARQVRIDVFDRHRRFIDQDADSERKTAERHDVHGLPGQPQPDQRRE